MAALIRPTIASYDVHESFVVDTQDHEDHTFCGVMFDVQCKDVLPLECVLVESLWVRGRLGPLTVWTTEGTFRGRHEEPDRWKRVYAGEHGPSFAQLVELKLAEPIVLRPGGGAGVYVHSTLPGDEALVYDNHRGARCTYEDRYVRVMPGVAHLSSTPFSARGMYWAAWRERREFVGRIAVGARFKLWNPERVVHAQFPRAFRAAASALLLRGRDDGLGRLTDDVIFYILNVRRVPSGARRVPSLTKSAPRRCAASTGLATRTKSTRSAPTCARCARSRRGRGRG